jgi:hypothetical protein
MKKLFSIILFLCLGFQIVFSQTYELLKFKESKDLKIKVGMSTKEVKEAIGNPKVVEVGFPSGESIIYDFPSMSGQLNYTTWIYSFQAIQLDLNERTNQGYFVNDKPVDKVDYEAYKNLTEVYLYEGKVINPDMADGYKQTKSKKLSTEPKLNAYYNPAEKSSNKSSLTPIYCVIFDKGTQVVAQTRAFLLR